MSTRSAIILKVSDEKYSGIYCHSDGYPKHVGKILHEHYQDAAKIAALIALGDISTLGADIGSKHAFDDCQHPTWVRAYGRDRGEIRTGAKHGKTAEHVCKRIAHEYAYVYENGSWTVAHGDEEGVPLAQALKVAVHS